MDKYYKNNPHLLPFAQQPGTAQANFAANLVQVGPVSPAKVMRLLSTNPFCATTITEVANEDDLPGLDNSSEDLEDIECMVEVLQVRAKEIRDDRKRTNPGKENLPKPGHPAKDCTDDILLMQPTLPVLKVVIPSKAPPVKPLPPAPPPSIPSVLPQFRYSAPVELSVDTVSVISQVLSEKVFLSIEELLALSPEVRKYFKEVTTTRHLLVPPTVEAHTVSTFSLRTDPKLLEAEPALPLRTLDVILDGMTLVTGILDSGCQVVIFRRDVWERLGAPLKHDRVMFME